MKRWIFILSGVLAAQLVLAAVLNLTGEEYGAFQAEEKLLSFKKQAVGGLRIEDGTDSVVLNKQEGRWLLSERGDFPASQRDVERLLDKLAALEKGWPVAKTRGAARRFRVDKDQFAHSLGRRDRNRQGSGHQLDPPYEQACIGSAGQGALRSPS